MAHETGLGIVSIRARHCWRAMQGEKVCIASFEMFQSAPAIAGGRCVRKRFIDLDELVSIRARHCWRAMPLPSRDMPWAFKCFNPRPPLLAGDAASHDRDVWHDVFQSAPAIAGGRCPGIHHTQETRVMFQSAPAIAGGRCARRHSPANCQPEVSIRARHCWRAMPSAFWVPPHRPCFNPRPPLLAGDARLIQAHRRPITGFNPRPPLLAGDATTMLLAAPWWTFQSAPAIAGGRCRFWLGNRQ